MNSIAACTAGLGLVVLFLATACQATTDSPAPSPNTIDSTLPAALLGLVLIPILPFVVRRLLVRQVTQMMAASAEQEAVVIEELQASCLKCLSTKLI